MEGWEEGTGRRNKGDSLGESQSFSNFRGIEERNSDQSTQSKMKNLGPYLLSNPCHAFSKTSSVPETDLL